MGAYVSFIYTLSKDVTTWLRRQLAKPRHWWRKRKFVEEGWEPTLKKINQGTEAVFSKNLLTDAPEVLVREEDESKQYRKYGKTIKVFVSDDEIKSKQLDNESLIGVTKHIIKARTSSFRPYLPSDIRQASDDVATESVIWDIRPDALDDFYETLEKIDDEILLARSKVEQMILGAEYDDFCRQIVEDYSGEKPCSRIQTMVSEAFERSFKKLQESFRGLLIKISASRFNYLAKGLKVLLLPYDIPQLTRYNDAYVFLWIYPDGIRGFGALENITSGKYEDLWKLYTKTHCIVDGMDQDAVYQAMSSWVKGLGGKKGRQSKGRPSSGPALNISFGIIGQITEMLTPINKEEFRTLVNSRLTDFSMLTQEQVNKIILRGR